MQSIDQKPTYKKFSTLTLPGSKSLTQRALLIASLAHGVSILHNPLYADDTEVMITALKTLGIRIIKEEYQLTIHGTGGRFKNKAEINLKDCGTAARFLLALLSSNNGEYLLTGSERLEERPFAPLFEGLSGSDRKFLFHKKPGFLPATILGNPLDETSLYVDGKLSSQFASGIALTLPLAAQKTYLNLSEGSASLEYLQMTLAMMRQFGADISFYDPKTIICNPASPYKSRSIFIEGDLSTASYFAALAAIHQGEITLQHAHQDSLQSEKAFFQFLCQMGCVISWQKNAVTIKGPPKLQGITANMNNASDTAMTLAIVCLFAQNPSKIHSIAHIRNKESDRVAVLSQELRKIGAEIEELPDGWIIYPLKDNGKANQVIINPHNDHRIAMALAILGTKKAGVTINQSSCVEKSYPGFFEVLAKL